MVEICDTYDACSSVEIASAITVIDKSFTAAELDQTAASISKALKSGNLDINLFHNVQRFYILLKKTVGQLFTIAILNYMTSNL